MDSVACSLSNIPHLLLSTRLSNIQVAIKLSLKLENKNQFSILQYTEDKKLITCEWFTGFIIKISPYHLKIFTNKVYKSSICCKPYSHEWSTEYCSGTSTYLNCIPNSCNLYFSQSVPT